MPRNTQLRLRLSRPLLPSTATRQAIRLYTGTAGAPPIMPHYDVLTGELVFTIQGQLQPKTLYRVDLEGPTAEGFGLRAFDGAPLDLDGLASWSFVTSGQADPALAVRQVREPTCDDVLARLSPSCGAGCCHGEQSPAMGLRLGTGDGLRRTALHRVAHETDYGSALGAPLADPGRFGVGMPIVDPANPFNSYLVYKLLVKHENRRPCESRCDEFADLPGADDCGDLSDEETSRLADWFMEGAPMPLDPSPRESSDCAPVDPVPLDCRALRVLTRWIENGARCE